MKTPTRICSWLIVAALQVYLVATYPNGAPSGACSSMTPNHGSNAQTSAIPYDIKVSANTYCPNNEVNVTLRGAPYGVTFKGFLCQARTTVNTDATSGTLESIDSVIGTTNKCAGAASLTHSNRDVKTAVHFKWTPDNTKTDFVTIVCTVVQQKSTFWVKQSGAEIMYAGADRCTPDGNTKGLPTTCTTSETCEMAVSMAICDPTADADGECVCRPDMKIAHPTHTFCSPKRLTDPCMSDSDCMAIAETVCDKTKTPHVCACKSAFTYNSTEGPCYLKVLGDMCSTNDDCRGIPKSVCDNQVCNCPSEYRKQSNQTHINCVLKDSDVCMMDTDCTGTNGNRCVDGKCTSDALKAAVVSVLLLFGAVFTALQISTF